MPPRRASHGQTLMARTRNFPLPEVQSEYSQSTFRAQSELQSEYIQTMSKLTILHMLVFKRFNEHLVSF